MTRRLEPPSLVWTGKTPWGSGLRGRGFWEMPSRRWGCGIPQKAVLIPSEAPIQPREIPFYEE